MTMIVGHPSAVAIGNDLYQELKRRIMNMKNNNSEGRWLLGRLPCFPADKQLLKLSQADHAALFANYSDRKHMIVFGGHSIGSYTAEMLAAEFDLPAVTFESPGLGRTVSLKKQNIAAKRVVGFCAGPNIINSLHMDPLCGARFRLYIPWVMEVFSRRLHLVNSIVSDAILRYTGLALAAMAIIRPQASAQWVAGLGGSSLCCRIVRMGIVAAAIAGIALAIAGIALGASIAELLAQHGICNMQAFAMPPMLAPNKVGFGPGHAAAGPAGMASGSAGATPGSGGTASGSAGGVLPGSGAQAPFRAAQIHAWPRSADISAIDVGERHIRLQVQQVLQRAWRALVPTHPKAHGLHNMLDPGSVYEARVESLHNYKVKELEGDVAKAAIAEAFASCMNFKL